MKKIEAIVRSHTVENIHTALMEAGFGGLTVSEVRGYGRQKGHKETYRGTEYSIDFVPKIKLEIVCTDDKAEAAISIILNNAKTGKVGDGKIFVSTIEESIRIRTEESGESAI